jgi:hypothetical protein
VTTATLSVRSNSSVEESDGRLIGGAESLLFRG